MAAGELARWEVEPLERPRRGLDERLMLAMPSLRRLLTRRAASAPAGSRMRRAALTRSVRTGYAAVNRGDYAAMRAAMHPQVEVIPPQRGSGALGFEPVYRGPEGAVEFVKQWKAGFARFTYEPREIVDAGGELFAVRLGMIARMRGANVDVSEDYGVLMRVTDGAVIRQEGFRDWHEALAALEAARVTAAS
jgi:ketosteroid isomerase-like protein